MLSSVSLYSKGEVRLMFFICIEYERQGNGAGWCNGDCVWRNDQCEEEEKYVKDLTTGLWFIPESDPFKVPSITEEDFEKGPEVDYERKEEFADFYSSDNYVKDETTNLMMAPTTEETCKANNGFVCKVSLDAGDVTSMIIMMMMMI